MEIKKIPHEQETLEDGSRFYKVNGVEYVSSTTALDIITPPRLKKAFKQSTPAKRKEWDAKRDFGTKAHAMVEDDLNGKKVDVPEDMKDFWVKWLEVRPRINPIETETMIYSDLGFAGKFDFVCELDGVPTVCDLKTGWLSTKAGWQLASYALGIKERFGEQVQMAVIQIKDEPKIFKYEHFDFCIERFLCALETYKGLQYNYLKKRDYKFLHTFSVNQWREIWKK